MKKGCLLLVGDLRTYEMKSGLEQGDQGHVKLLKLGRSRLKHVLGLCEVYEMAGQVVGIAMSQHALRPLLYVPRNPMGARKRPADLYLICGEAEHTRRESSARCRRGGEPSKARCG